MHIYILPQCSTTAASVLNSAGMDAQFERSCCAISRGILSRWDSHGQYTVIICLRYYPSIQVLDKLTQFEALTVEDMEKSLSKCCTRNDRIWIKDVYSDRLFTIRKSIAEIKKQLNIL